MEQTSWKQGTYMGLPWRVYQNGSSIQLYPRCQCWLSGYGWAASSCEHYGFFIWKVKSENLEYLSSVLINPVERTAEDLVQESRRILATRIHRDAMISAAKVADRLSRLEQFPHAVNWLQEIGDMEELAKLNNDLHAMVFAGYEKPAEELGAAPYLVYRRVRDFLVRSSLHQDDILSWFDRLSEEWYAEIDVPPISGFSPLSVWKHL